MNGQLCQLLDDRLDLQHHLYTHGFLLTSADISGNSDRYPFYSNWKSLNIDQYSLWHHRRQSVHVVDHSNIKIFLVGHAYDPYEMQIDETEILTHIAIALSEDFNSGIQRINSLSGIFVLGWISEGTLHFINDAAGMQHVCYGTVGGQLYVTSHMQLVGDLCGLSHNTYVRELTTYRWFKYMFGNNLPGDTTAYTELRRIIPNTFLTYGRDIFTVQRFFPSAPAEYAASPSEYEAIVVEAGRILQRSMKLIAHKWKNPAISLTGGIDSGTTIAAATDVLDKYSTFTYVAMPREAIDAEAATVIADHLGVKHTIIRVPDHNYEVPDFDAYSMILAANAGQFGQLKDDDTRKKIILMQTDLGDIEVKSWVGEIARAYAYNYFGRSKMPKKLTPRHCTSLYKVFLANRRLVHQTDSHFSDYLETTALNESTFNYDATDLYMWEIFHGGKESLNIGSMRFSMDLTIPYNNRRLLSTLLRAPLELRRSDRLLLDVQSHLNDEIPRLGVRVVNANETSRRKALINGYFKINTRIPF